MNNIHGLNHNSGGGGGGGSAGGNPMASMFGGGGGGQDRDCLTMMKESWKQVPVFSKYLVYVCLAIYLSSFFVTIIAGFMQLTPAHIYMF